MPSLWALSALHFFQISHILLSILVFGEIDMFVEAKMHPHGTCSLSWTFGALNGILTLFLGP